MVVLYIAAKNVSISKFPAVILNLHMFIVTLFLE